MGIRNLNYFFPLHPSQIFLLFSKKASLNEVFQNKLIAEFQKTDYMHLLSYLDMQTIKHSRNRSVLTI